MAHDILHRGLRSTLMEATNTLAQEAMAPITERFAQISPISGPVG